MTPLNVRANARQAIERMGLATLNTLARGRHYELTTRAFGSHHRQHLDHYRQSTRTAAATVIFYYGGGWESGARRDYRFVADTLLRLGVDVVIPDYRLYPDARFDAIWDDAECAFREIRGQLDGPVYLMGHSAGAQLAALLALRVASGELDVDGFIGIAGPYDFYPFTDDHHWDLFGPDYESSQPVNFVRPDAAPMYLLHGADDNRVRRGHSKSLMEKQQAAGGLATREVYENTGHVDIILSFSALHRRRSPVVADIARFMGVADAR